MKATAVKWLQKELIKRFKRSQLHYTDSEWCFDMIKKLSEQAKEMEKEQICNAYNFGQQIPPFEYAEQYYNETFKSE
jgi:hypothetical protein